MSYPPPANGPTAGALALRAHVHALFPAYVDAKPDGIYNPRCVEKHPWNGRAWCHTPSQHAYGRAVDMMHPTGAPRQLGDDLAAYLTTVPGVAEVIWWRRRWTPALGWRRYTGLSPHEDHVHVSLTADAAASWQPPATNTGAEAMTPEQWADYQDFRVAVQRNDEVTWKKLDQLTAQLAAVAAAGGLGGAVDTEAIANQVRDELADALAKDPDA